MPLQVGGSVGPAVSADTDIGPPLRQGRTGDLIVSELQGRYYENAFRKSIFFAATPSGQTTTVGLATTYVGLVLSNPLGNQVNLAVLKIGWAESVITSAINAVGLLVGYSPTTNITHSTPVTLLQSSLIGVGPAPTAKVDTSAALVGTPAYLAFLNSTPTATTNVNGGMIDLEGSIIIPPGGYIATATVAASQSASFWASIMWAEVSL